VQPPEPERPANFGPRGPTADSQRLFLNWELLLNDLGDFMAAMDGRRTVAALRLLTLLQEDVDWLLWRPNDESGRGARKLNPYTEVEEWCATGVLAEVQEAIIWLRRWQGASRLGEFSDGLHTFTLAQAEPKARQLVATVMGPHTNSLTDLLLAHK